MTAPIKNQSAEALYEARQQGSLSPAQRQALEQRLQQEPELAKAFEQLDALHNLFDQAEDPFPKASSGLKYRFMADLERESAQEAPVRTIGPKSSWTAQRWAASVALLMVGLLAGIFLGEQKAEYSQLNALRQEVQEIGDNVLLGQLTQQSTAARLEGVSASYQVPEADAEVIQALIERMHFDQSANVRLEATRALYRFAQQEKVKRAYVNTLFVEKDPAIQIEVIQYLAELEEKSAVVPLKNLLEHPDTYQLVKEYAQGSLNQLL